MIDDDVILIPSRSRDGSVRAWAIVDREDADLAELRWAWRHWVCTAHDAWSGYA